MVNPIKTKKRGRGRPRSEDRLLIDSERTQFKIKNKIIELSPDALDIIYNLMMDQKSPPQVRSGNARILLDLASELHKELIASEAAQEEVEEVPSDDIEDDQQKGIVVNFNGG